MDATRTNGAVSGSTVAGMTGTADDDVEAYGLLQRRVRWLLVRGLSAAIVGLLVLGVGGRLVMLGSRLLHPDAVGRLTENGNRVGEVTLDGTIELLVFGGLLSGLAAGVVWALTAEWLPRRWWVVGSATLALGGPSLIDPDNRDFQILDPPTLDLVLLLGLLFGFGVALLAVDNVLTRRMAPAAGDLGTVLQALLVLGAAALVIPVFGSFFSREFCFCDDPPWWTGTFLVLAAVASVWWWVAELAGRENHRPRAALLGHVAVAAAIGVATVDLVRDIIEIV